MSLVLGLLVLVSMSQVLVISDTLGLFRDVSVILVLTQLLGILVDFPPHPLPLPWGTEIQPCEDFFSCNSFICFYPPFDPGFVTVLTIS